MKRVRVEDTGYEGDKEETEEDSTTEEEPSERSPGPDVVSVPTDQKYCGSCTNQNTRGRVLCACKGWICAKCTQEDVLELDDFLRQSADT